MAVRRPGVEPDPGPAGGRVLESRDPRNQPGGRTHELLRGRRGELGLAVEGLAPEADGVLVAGPDQEAAPRLAPVPLLGGVIDGAGRRLEHRQPVQQSGANGHREHGEVDANLGGQRSRPCPGREDDGGRGDPLGPSLDPGDAAPLGQESRRPRIDEDTPAPAPDTGEETPDAVRWVGMTALRLPRRGADPLRLQVREELLEGAGFQDLRRDPHRLHQGHVLLERRDQRGRHDEEEAAPAVSVVPADQLPPARVDFPALVGEVGLVGIGVVAADVARGPPRRAGRGQALLDDDRAQPVRRREERGGCPRDARAHDDEIGSLGHAGPSSGFTRMRYRYGSLVMTAPPETRRTAPETHSASSEAK